MKIYRQVPRLHKTAIALGCFDGIHLGHQAVIEKLHDPLADGLDKCVFSFSDDIPFKSGAAHIASFDDKCEILSGMGVAELILPSFDSMKEYTPELFFHEILLNRLDAKLVVCGDNYRFGKNAAGDSSLLRHFCRESGTECLVVPSVCYEGKSISSSRIREALGNGDVQAAASMLGRHFSYCLEVVHGCELGRQLGTPTINQFFPGEFLIPAYGVYASVTEVDGVRYPSVTNIGVKPTVGSSGPLSETWIIGYRGDLYGRRIRVSLIEYMRGECKFDSIEQLKEAIHRDGATAEQYTSDWLGEGEQFGI